MQAYSNPEVENEPNALPNIEIFYVSPLEALYNKQNADHANEYTIFEAGWYYWFCFPGCLPDSDLTGPFNSKEEALKNAQGG